MAQVWTNAKVTVGTVDLSDQASKVTAEMTLDGVDVTTFGSSNKAVAPGLGDATITVSFFQNFSSGKVHSVLSSVFSNSRAGTPGSIEILPVNTTISATNPAIRMPSCYLLSYTPIDASIGDSGSFDAVFSNAGTAGITFSTT